METYLAHYGILGMKWGVRRYQNKDGTLTASGQNRYSKKMTAKRKAAAKKKASEDKKRSEEQQRDQPRDVKSMTDDEIRQFLNRRDLEKRYLEAVTPKTVEKGQSTVEKYLAKFGNELASSIATGAAKRVANSLLESVFGSDQKNKNNKSNAEKDAEEEMRQRENEQKKRIRELEKELEVARKQKESANA